MKKALILCLIFLLTPAVALASGAVKNFTLKEDSVFLLLFDSEAKSFKISNPNVVSIQVVNTLENDRHQVILQTISEGFTNLSVETKDATYEYKINVGNKSKIDDCDDIFEVEKPENEVDEK